MSNEPTAHRSFPASPSSGVLSLVATAAVALAILLVPLASGGVPGPTGVGIAAAGALLAAFLLVAAAALPRMRYTVSGTELVASCGPLLTYRIPLREIAAVTRVDLTPTVWAALRLPGVALYTVRYVEYGKVRMCARRAAQGILLVETRDRRRYGFTPAREADFVAALRRNGDSAGPAG